MAATNGSHLKIAYFAHFRVLSKKSKKRTIKVSENDNVTVQALQMSWE